MTQEENETNRREQSVVLLRNFQNWQRVFNIYDTDGDGRISLQELNAAIENDRNIHHIPHRAVRRMHKRHDEDNSGYLDFQEFVKMIESPENKTVFGHLNRYMNNYVGLAAPQKIPRRRDASDDFPGEDEVDLEYEDQYTCRPPALGMLIISIIEVALFAYDAIAEGEIYAQGKVASVMIYDPYQRYEAWRFVTYMFVHVGYAHLIINLLVQIMLGIPLEMVHRSWRVGLVYVAGVCAGSLGTSITSPRVYLAGASGGVYALITAHLATILMNWQEMQYAVIQLGFFVILCSADVGTAIYNHLTVPDDKVGYSAHLFGGVAGLLVSILVLRNLVVLGWEKVLWWSCLVIYIALMLFAIIWNAAYHDYYPYHISNERTSV